jgi:hypothetical protein
MPQQSSAVVDDEYGLEKAPAAGGVTDSEYGLEPASGENKTDTEKESSEKPGFFKRLGQSLGLPTTQEELKTAATAKPSVAESVLGPIVPAAKGAYEWGKRAIKNIGEGGKEELEAARNIKEGGPVLPNIGKAAYGVVHGGVGSIPFIGEPIETAGQDVLNENYAGAAGGLTGVAGQVLAPEIAGRVRPGFSAARSGLGNIVVDEMGRPKPIPRLLLGNERATAAGEILKPEIAERKGAQEIRSAKAEMDDAIEQERLRRAQAHGEMTQDIASGQQARAAGREQMYSDLATSRANRGEEQAKLDTDFEKRLKAQEDARQKELAANERLKTMHGTDLMRRGAEQESIDTATAEKAGTIPKIVNPLEGEAVREGNEGRGATWTNEEVIKGMKEGDRAAIRQGIVRRLPMPENVRYVMGDPDYERAVLNPREVTRFTPEGEPIRDKSNPFTEEPTARIPTIARTPKPGIIPKIGENTPRGTSLPFPGPMPESLPAAVAVGEKPQSITERPAAKPAAEAPTLLEPRAPFGIKPLEGVKPIMPREMAGEGGGATGRIPAIGEPETIRMGTGVGAEGQPETAPLAEQPPTESIPAPESPAVTETKPLGSVTPKERSARIAKNIAKLEQGLNRPAPEANATPAPIQEAIEGTNWKFEGKNDLGLYTIQEPGTNIKLSLFERELNPSFIRRKIAEKEKQYGVPKKTAKEKEQGKPELNF